MKKCARSACLSMGVHRCSVCLREPYCSGSCQKGDWKAHKLICQILKKLSLQHEPYPIVIELINDTKIDNYFLKNELKIRVLEHLISYTEHQFGDRVPGREYRERGNGIQIDYISNYEVEIDYLADFYNSLTDLYQINGSSAMVCDELSFISLEKMFDLLRPWSPYLNLNSIAAQTHLIGKDQINRLIELSSKTEREMARVYTNRNLFQQADSHCCRAISLARFYKGDEKTKADLLYESLACSYENLCPQGKFTDGLIFLEEGYNCISMSYEPTHFKVQKAANALIGCLIQKGDLYDAGYFLWLIYLLLMLSCFW